MAFDSQLSQLLLQKLHILTCWHMRLQYGQVFVTVKNGVCIQGLNREK